MNSKKMAYGVLAAIEIVSHFGQRQQKQDNKNLAPLTSRRKNNLSSREYNQVQNENVPTKGL
uniref:Uncharacterized protein n=1 Tax=Bionectria ochroleuca TaxID=29856 RepID=A0A8H7NKU9_BIOOC